MAVDLRRRRFTIDEYERMAETGILDEDERVELMEPRDALLVVEVMDSSVYRDRSVKLPLYARARVPEVWLVDVSLDTVEICREPVGRRYRSTRVAARGEQIAPLAFPDVSLAVTDLVG